MSNLTRQDENVNKYEFYWVRKSRTELAQILLQALQASRLHQMRCAQWMMQKCKNNWMWEVVIALIFEFSVKIVLCAKAFIAIFQSVDLYASLFFFLIYLPTWISVNLYIYFFSLNRLKVFCLVRCWGKRCRWGAEGCIVSKTTAGREIDALFHPVDCNGLLSERLGVRLSLGARLSQSEASRCGSHRHSLHNN